MNIKTFNDLKRGMLLLPNRPKAVTAQHIGDIQTTELEVSFDMTKSTIVYHYFTVAKGGKGEPFFDTLYTYEQIFYDAENGHANVSVNAECYTTYVDGIAGDTRFSISEDWHSDILDDLKALMEKD